VDGLCVSALDLSRLLRGEGLLQLGGVLVGERGFEDGAAVLFEGAIALSGVAFSMIMNSADVPGCT